MLSLLHLNSFKIFNIFLIFTFSIAVNNNLPILLSTSFYCIFYLFIIYLGIFYYRKSLFYIYFIYALLFDILLLNEIGPHLLVFITSLFFLNYSLRFLYNLSSIKVYFFIILLQIFMIFMQMIISYLLFDTILNYSIFYKIIVITFLLSYPIFLFFSKLDQFN